jgi:hypothetical protein
MADIICKAPVLKEWQQTLKVLVDEPPIPRKITFIVDEDGAGGKTWFAHYYTLYSNKRCSVFSSNTKLSKFMLHNIKCNSDVVFIDVLRSRLSHLDYELLEDIKDGYLPDRDDLSKVSLQQKSTHIVVLVNGQPNMMKMSPDRYFIIDVKEFNMEPIMCNFDE